MTSLITDRIRSMGEGYVFTSICLSTGETVCPRGVFRGGWCCQRGVGVSGGCAGESPILQKMRPPPIWEYGQCTVGTHPIGMHSCDK